MNNVFNNHPILIYLLILFIPSFVSLCIMHLIGVSENTGGIIGTVVACLSFAGAYLFAYKDDMDVVKDKFKESINEIRKLAKFLIGAILFLVLIFLIILTLPLQLAFWGWLLRFFIIVGGVGLIIALIYPTIKN